MNLFFTLVDPKRYRMRIEGAGHDPIETVLETRSLLLHDFAHYALESELGLEVGFYGLLASGVSLEDLRDPERMSGDALETLLSIEKQVAMLQSAFKRGADVSSMPGARRLRAVWGAWSKTRQGEALFLRWPAAEPEVVSARF